VRRQAPHARHGVRARLLADLARDDDCRRVSRLHCDPAVAARASIPPGARARGERQEQRLRPWDRRRVTTTSAAARPRRAHKVRFGTPTRTSTRRPQRFPPPRALEGVRHRRQRNAPTGASVLARTVETIVDSMKRWNQMQLQAAVGRAIQ